MKLDITPRAANLQYAIRDIVVAAKKYQKRTGEKPLYLNTGNPIKYDWRTPQYMVDAMCKTTQDGWHGYSPSEGEELLRVSTAEKEKRVNGISINPHLVEIISGISTNCSDYFLSPQLIC